MDEGLSHQLVTGISFGLTTAVITALGVMVGLYSATSSRLAVVAGLVVVAVADGLSDAMGLHVAEEAETERGEAKHTAREVWMTTVYTFLAVAGFGLTFAVPILLVPLATAVPVAVVWGILLLVALNYRIASRRGGSPVKTILEHVLLALLVVGVSHWLGSQISVWIG